MGVQARATSILNCRQEPGPGNMFFAANGARFGLRATLIAGSLYVLWLAWKLGTAGRAGHQEAKAASFWDGAVLLILNPKAYVIIALMFSQFLVATSSVLQVAVISVIFTLNVILATVGGWMLVS